MGMSYNFFNIVNYITAMMDGREEDDFGFTEETKKDWYIFLGYLRKGFNFKKGTSSWIICKNFDKNNDELLEIFEREKGKKVSRNNIIVSKHDLNKCLQTMLPDEFFDSFTTNDTKKTMCMLRMLMYRPIASSLFIDEVIDIDISREELYAATKVKDVLEQIKRMRKYTRDELTKGIEEDINPALLYYIIKKLDEDCVVRNENGKLGHVNYEKLEMLDALGY